MSNTEQIWAQQFAIVILLLIVAFEAAVIAFLTANFPGMQLPSWVPPKIREWCK